MLADGSDVLPGTEDVVRRAQQLRADAHGEYPAREEEEEHDDRVLQADDLVVEGGTEIAGPALRRNARERLPTDELGRRIVEHAGSGEPTQHPEDQGEDEGDVVLPVVLYDRLIGGDDIAAEVPEEVSDDRPDECPEGVRGKYARPSPHACACAGYVNHRLSCFAHVIEPIRRRAYEDGLVAP